MRSAPSWVRIVAAMCGLTACIAAALPWTKQAGLSQGSAIFGLSTSSYRLSGRLVWEGSHPPVVLLVAMTAVGAAAFVLAAAKPDTRLLGLLFATSPIFAVLLAAGNPMAWPWNLPSGPHLAPASGYWLAVVSLILAALGLVGLVVRGFLRRSAQVQHRKLAGGVRA
jgi:hypothetical protein